MRCALHLRQPRLVNNPGQRVLASLEPPNANEANQILAAQIGLTWLVLKALTTWPFSFVSLP
jgi:hypothetical protein